MTIRSPSARSFTAIEQMSFKKTAGEQIPQSQIGTDSSTLEYDKTESFQDIFEGIYEPIVRDLVTWLFENDLLIDMQASFDIALAYNIKEMEMLGVQTLKDFFDYMNRMLRWIPHEQCDGKDIYHRLVVFYLIFNQPPIGRRQTDIHPDNVGKMSWLSQWLVDFAFEVGKFHDTPESITDASLQSFYDTPAYKMHHYIKPRGGWKTFNQFFARNFKPGYRTIHGLSDPTIVTSPADCTYGGSWSVDSNSIVTIKHLHWSINELLKGSKYADEFRGGVFTHSFLNTFDYHRIHAPVSGRVVEARVIQGQAYFEVHTQYQTQGYHNGQQVSTCKAYAPNSPGYQFVQTRGLIILDSPIGLVAILPVGMASVSSVVMTAEEGVILRKGEEMGYFQFGGSDIVMVFQERARVALTAVEDVHYSMGFQVGTAVVQ